tara:strand:+ start:995 stop:1099 length:105 start_codon:yes stop_codon:yes gene_type:complete
MHKVLQQTQEVALVAAVVSQDQAQVEVADLEKLF